MHTCSIHNHIGSGFSIYQRDPTRTTVLRDTFAKEMAKRFRKLRGMIRKVIVQQDGFNLTSSPPLIYAGQFDFPRTQDKIISFMEWLNEGINSEILEIKKGQQIGDAIEDAWTNQYIQTAYQKGIQRGRAELIGVDFQVPDLEAAGGIEAAFNQPFHIDRVGVLYTRTFSDLKGITDNMDTQISRVLSQAMADGKNPNEIARLLTKTISGPVGDLGITDSLGRFIPAERRAKILARTEIIRAHHQAMMQEYRNWGAEGVMVKAEWQTAGDNRVCAECASLEGRVYSLDEMQNKIPLHPQCRCVALPVKVRTELPPVQEPDIPTTVPPVSDSVVSKFRNVTDGEAYLQYKEEYKQKLLDEIGQDKLKEISAKFHKEQSDPIVELRQFVEKDTSLIKMREAAKVWQGSTNYNEAMALKIRANELEQLPEVLYKNPKNADIIQRAADSFFTNDDWVKIRAFNQAYMEVIDVPEKVTLYRGTDGGTGELFRQSIVDNNLTEFQISESTLTGYTEHPNIADSFGASRNGITVKQEVARGDIVLHKDLISGITADQIEETEWIIVGNQNKSIPIKDIKYKPDTSKYGPGQFKDFE